MPAGRKHNNKVTFVFLDFTAFTLNESEASHCELLKLERCKTLVRIWIRGIHNSLATLRRGDGRDGRNERKEDGVKEWGWRSCEELEDIDFNHVRVSWTWTWHSYGWFSSHHITALSLWLAVTVEKESMCVWERFSLSAPYDDIDWVPLCDSKTR